MDLSRASRKLRFNLKARMSLYDRLAKFLSANIDLVRSLKTIRDRYKEQKDYRADVLTEWIIAMENGQKFSEAIQDWVPAGEHMLIAANERGKGLVHGLEQAGVLSSAASRIKGAIIGGALFPIILVFALCSVILMFRSKMMPVFTTLLPIAAWPASGRSLAHVANFIHDEAIFLIAFAIGVTFVIGKTMGTWVRSPRPIFDHFPPWSIYRSQQASSFLIALASLISAGISNYDALRMMSRNASPWMRRHLMKMMAAMKLGGDEPGKALNTGLMDREAAGDVEDYSKLSSFQSAIFVLGERSLEEGVKSIQLKMAIAKNIMLVLVAVSIVWVYSSSYALQGAIAEQMQSGHH
jgi:type II secretory pathway component PulF